MRLNRYATSPDMTALGEDPFPMRTVAGWVGLLALAGLVGCASDAVAPPAQQGVQLDLPTSDWEPGDDMMFAQVTGVLRLDAQDCVTLGDARTPLVWPKGFTAYRRDGEVTLYGPDGEVVATEGDTVQSGGGEVPVDPSVSHSECLSSAEKMWAIQGDVRVVASVAVPSLEGIVDVAEAKAVLGEAGFVVEVEYLDCAPDGFCKQGVVDTIPPQGSAVPIGSTVRLRAR